MKEISIIIPIYNEQRALSSVIENIKQVMDNSRTKYEIIAVNDCSTDNSGEILDKIKKIKIIHHPINRGYGASLISGIKAAKHDHILITDADGTYPIKDIPKLFIDSYDMVIGARTGKNVHIPLLRRPAKAFLTFLANFLSGYKIPDLNSGLRIFKKDLALEFMHLYPQRFSFTTTITLAFLTSGYTVKFVPINYYNRKGKSTIHPIKDFIKFNNLILRIVTYFNPFKIFFTVSIIFFALALIVFLYTFLSSGRVADITVILFATTAVQIFLFGLLADLIVKNKKLP